MNGKRDDMDARFEQFYAANFPRVKNFARLLTKSEEDAEEILPKIYFLSYGPVLNCGRGRKP